MTDAVQVLEQPTETSAPPTMPVYRLSVADYHRLIDADILPSGTRVELIEGLLVDKFTKKPQHRISTQLTREALQAMLPEGWCVDHQEPITMEDSEPEPDVAVIRGQRRTYTQRHPGPEEVALVAEVAESSLLYDRTVKQRVYANARIPFYWLLNVNERWLEVYSIPTGSASAALYAQRNIYTDNQSAPLIIEGQEIGQRAVSACLP